MLRSCKRLCPADNKKEVIIAGRCKEYSSPLSSLNPSTNPSIKEKTKEDKDRWICIGFKEGDGEGDVLSFNLVLIQKRS